MRKTTNEFSRETKSASEHNSACMCACVFHSAPKSGTSRMGLTVGVEVFTCLLSSDMYIRKVAVAEAVCFFFVVQLKFKAFSCAKKGQQVPKKMHLFLWKGAGPNVKGAEVVAGRICGRLWLIIDVFVMFGSACIGLFASE